MSSFTGLFATQILTGKYLFPTLARKTLILQDNSTAGAPVFNYGGPLIPSYDPLTQKKIDHL